MTFCPLPKAFHVTFLLARVGRTRPSLGPGHHWLQWSLRSASPHLPGLGNNELSSWWPGLQAQMETRRVRDCVLCLVKYILFESTGARNTSTPFPALSRTSVSL